jgi:hypothetical protein
MFTYTYERQDIIQIALKRLPGGGSDYIIHIFMAGPQIHGRSASYGKSYVRGSLWDPKRGDLAES